MKTIEQLKPIQGLTNANAVESRSVGTADRQSPGAVSFAELLKKELHPTGMVHFSKHALQRLEARNIELSAQDAARLSHGIDRAAEKGAQDSLMLLRDLALIVNVQSRTVVTAVPKENMREGVFTNIDSAVLL
jgi:flagellar operon protein